MGARNNHKIYSKKLNSGAWEWGPQVADPIVKKCQKKAKRSASFLGNLCVYLVLRGGHLHWNRPR